ncbi:hypothetical protein FBZ96_11245 [Bradyrhizobium stylosanthis]|uniref:Uncharacterized protein n=1 Tax=Bradyrhizobium stylosanthis TaxID=1803665 RepID=A0A560D4K7_9BRAD|nr:hypothetical protein FBZ96_11245 [Bradyrhizobium stylosanthis]
MPEDAWASLRSLQGQSAAFLTASPRHLPIFAPLEQDHIPASAPHPQASYGRVDGYGARSHLIPDLRSCALSALAVASKATYHRRTAPTAWLPASASVAHEAAAQSGNLNVASCLSYPMPDIHQDYHPMLIAGSPSHLNLMIEVRNPFTGMLVGKVSQARPEHVLSVSGSGAHSPPADPTRTDRYSPPGPQTR